LCGVEEGGKEIQRSRLSGNVKDKRRRRGKELERGEEKKKRT